LKALPCGGADTAIYKDKIAHYWGVDPFEQYGSTEEGAIATQCWNKRYMTFFPDAAFYEFIPEEEWYRWHCNPAYRPQTVLLNEVRPGKKYELVITNFYGKPLLRYRTYDLIEFPILEDAETGVKLPQMAFVGRSNDFIDLAGFTGLIDEKMVWKAISNTGIPYQEWAMRKEKEDGNPILRLYMEPIGAIDKETIQRKVHEALKGLNSFYADYEAMIEKPALEVTVLNPGTFQHYMQKKQAAGADLAHLKPPHMNPTDEVISLLLDLDQQVN
jgi:phenylacetate-coenzyme A ligase PaaK-like adenylate-forming protein